MSTVTVKDLDDLIAKLAAKEKEVKVQADVTKALNKEYAALEGKIAAHMKELERETYDSPFGKFKISDKWRVNMPQNDIEKEKLWAHLRERGIFERYATVNSNSLNALFMRDWEEAKLRGEGMTFTMPGVPAPTHFTQLQFKAAK